MTTERLTPARGFLMGLADAVPGVSGGTVALLLGIHPRLVHALSSIRPSVLGVFWGARRTKGRAEARAAWHESGFTFLALLFLGLLVGLFSGAKALVVLLERWPMAMAALFLSLLLASVPVPARRAGTAPRSLLVMGAAALLASTITVLPAAQASLVWWSLPLLGALAACAMILPGISGSYILLLLGAYTPVLHAVAALDLSIIALVGIGAVAGLLAFGHGLRWLFLRHEAVTYAAMVGLLLGSVGRLWPWRSEPGFAEGTPIVPGPEGWVGVLVGALVGLAFGRGLSALAERSSSPEPPSGS